jgi:hypothetical protein
MTAALPATATAELRSLVGSEDLIGGLCQTMDPDIWLGEWCDIRRTSDESRAERARHVERAARLCRVCPVLAACSRQLELFEAKNQPVTGVMAGREFTPQISIEKRLRGLCRNCGRPMVAQIAMLGRRPPLPDGLVYVGGHGRCQSCASKYRDGKLKTTTEKEKAS